MPETPLQFSFIESKVHSLLRVPPYPHLPAGSPDSIQVFQSGRNYYKLCLLSWLAFNSFLLFVFAVIHKIGDKISHRMPELAQHIWGVAEGLAVIAFLAFAVFTFYAQKLDFTLRWYIITDRSLRIRTGVFYVEELTMTFSNIQDIRVTAGPLQNFLKLADVEVHSAGGGSGVGAGGHVGRFENVSNANEIRELLVERLRTYRDSGLGESAPAAGAQPGQANEAARSVLTEAQALRAQMEIFLARVVRPE